jgi:hypothetical protein
VKKIQPDVLIQRQLYPDMLPLSKQIRSPAISPPRAAR